MVVRPLFATARIVSRLTTRLAGAATITFGGLYLWTNNCKFEPFGPSTDKLFQHGMFKKINPFKNSTSHDCYVRRVPYEGVDQDLLEDARRGGTKLIEAFAQGMWGGYGKF